MYTYLTAASACDLAKTSEPNIKKAMQDRIEKIDTEIKRQITIGVIHICFSDIYTKTSSSKTDSILVDINGLIKHYRKQGFTFTIAAGDTFISYK